MKARVSIATLGMVAALAACAPEGTSGPPGDGSAAADSPGVIGVVEVSNYPLAYVAARLAGPLLTVSFRAADAADPAYWRPTAEQVVAMQEADLIVINGAGYEGWLREVSLPASRIVDTTAAVRDRLLAAESAMTHSHGLEGEHAHTATAITTWLDPTLLAAQARAAEAAMARAWPEHAGAFAEALAAVTADLDAVDAEVAEVTAAAAGTPVLFSHPVYQYLQARYGLAGASLHWEPDVLPGPDQWMQFERVRNGAAWMIWEAEPLAGIAERLAAAGVGVVVVSPIASPPANGDLLTVMRQNAEALRTVFVDYE